MNDINTAERRLTRLAETVIEYDNGGDQELADDMALRLAVMAVHYTNCADGLAAPRFLDLVDAIRQQQDCSNDPDRWAAEHDYDHGNGTQSEEYVFNQVHDAMRALLTPSAVTA